MREHGWDTGRYNGILVHAVIRGCTSLVFLVQKQNWTTCHGNGSNWLRTVINGLYDADDLSLYLEEQALLTDLGRLPAGEICMHPLSLVNDLFSEDFALPATRHQCFLSSHDHWAQAAILPNIWNAGLACSIDFALERKTLQDIGRSYSSREGPLYTDIAKRQDNLTSIANSMLKWWW